jgi:tetratricopeptide (TPR) repeat protein
LGRCSKSDGQLAEAEIAADRAITVLESVCRKHPNNPQARQELSNAYTLRAQIRIEAGRYEDAVPDWDAAHDHGAGSVRPQAAIMRAWTKAKLGQFHEATAELESLKAADHVLAASGEKWPGEALYTMARVYGRAALGAGDAHQLSEAARREVADRYTRRAMDLLRRCRGAGYFQDAVRLDNAELEPDLEPVRQIKSIREIITPASDED